MDPKMLHYWDKYKEIQYINVIFLSS